MTATSINKMCYTAVDNYSLALEFGPDCYRTEKSVIKLLIVIPLQYNLSLIHIRLEKCAIKLLTLVLLYLILCLVNTSFKKYVIELFHETINDVRLMV